jgi:serine phosphatase RsbU (regulator of sigma subunit)
VVIGDVMGHDTLAAAAMAQLRSIVRTLGMVGDDDPAQVLTRTDVLMRASGIDTPATASVVRLPPPDQQPGDERPSTVLEWSNAGHPPPLLIGADGDVRLLEAADTDLLLGIEPTTRRRLTRSRLRAGETLLLYTDGLVERRDQPLGEGIALLREVAARAASTTSDPEELADAVLAAMLPAPSSDDVAVVAVVLR